MGLEIGDDAVRLAVTVTDGPRRVVRCHQTRLPDGAVEHGRVMAAGAVGDAIRSAVAALGIRPRGACLVLDGRRTICRVEPLVEGHEAATRAASADRVRRYLPFGGQPTVVAHAEYKLRALDAGQSWLVTAATLSDVLSSQVAAARRGGLAVVRAVPGVAAVVQVLLARNDGIEPSYLLVGHAHGSEIGVVRGDGLIFCQRSASPPGELGTGGDELATTLGQLTDYHVRHTRGRGRIETCWCCGRGIRLEALAGGLADRGVDAVWLDPADLPGVDRVEAGDLDSPAGRAALTLAAAAALSASSAAGAVGHLDLMPPPRRRSRIRLLAPWLVVPAVVTLILTAGLATAEHALRRRAAHLVDAVSRPTAELAECSRLLRRESQLKERVDDATQLLGQAPLPAVRAFLAELPRRLVDDVWLDRVQLGDSGTCSLFGSALTEDAAFAFRRALSESPHVRAARLGGTGKETSGNTLLTRFRLDILLADDTTPDAVSPSNRARSAP